MKQIFLHQIKIKMSNVKKTQVPLRKQFIGKYWIYIYIHIIHTNTFFRKGYIGLIFKYSTSRNGTF